MPAVSIQVLQEMHVNLVRKGTAIDVSAALVARYLSWRVVENGKEVFRRSLEIQRRWQLSYWDSLIVAAALRAQAKELWTEDLNTDQVIEGMSIRNPLS
jgi:predicted nucleic acid-binding protein